MLAGVKKGKVASGCHNFQKWTNLYFFMHEAEKSLCLVCKETVTVFKENSIKRLYDTKHKLPYDQYVGLWRQQTIT